MSDKLDFIVKELLEANNLLFVSVNTLYKEEVRDDEKTYYPIIVLLLCFCFIDALRRFNYIFNNGKNGNENNNNAINYKKFLSQFLINNKEYKKYCYCFSADNLYEIRNDLVHSFSIRENYDNDFFSFVGGNFFENKKAIIELEEICKKKHPSARKNHIITLKSFLEIIKQGMLDMFEEWKGEIIKNKESEDFKSHLDDLYSDLEDTIRYYLSRK